MKKSIIITILLIIIAVSLFFYKRISEDNMHSKSTFRTQIYSVYIAVKNESDSSSKYHGRIDGVSCDSDLEYEHDRNISYYVKLDENSNIIKLYAYNDKWYYTYDGDGITANDLSTDKAVIRKNNNFKLSCNNQ